MYNSGFKLVKLKFSIDDLKNGSESWVEMNRVASISIQNPVMFKEASWLFIDSQILA